MALRACGRVLLVAILAGAAYGADPKELWVSPGDLERRNLFYGPGGKALVPPAAAVYTYKSTDKTGHSGGYEVTDARQREWKIKIGDEVGSEIAVSRILWAIGYHQPVMHYVAKWTMTGGPEAKAEPGRFRLESDHEKDGDWSWDDNPFIDSQPFRGLVAVNLLLNNWDMEENNNRIYRMKDKGQAPERRYVVQDLGASLAKTSWPIGGRNDIDGYESQSFVKGVDDGQVDFDYRGPHKALVKSVTQADVIWACRLVSRLSDKQLTDAFRAAGYGNESTSRYVRKIRQKLAEGLALDPHKGRAK